MKAVVIDLNEHTAEVISNLLGADDVNLKLIAQHFDTELEYEDGKINATQTDRLERLREVMTRLILLAEEGHNIETQDVASILSENFYRRLIMTTSSGRKFYLRTTGQKRLYEAFENNVMTFAVGPAGTGKTFLAVCYAYSLLKSGKIRKIIITRPVVESGESLGFLPGDVQDKVDPYLRPIYDSLEMLTSPENVNRMIERGIVEIAPLAYMRGRTLSDACVILDEAQNTTGMQIKMFLTRLGFNAKMIITGDLTQIGLPSYKSSGLIQAIETLRGIEEVAIIETDSNDVVRHPLVSRIINAYSRKESEK